MENTILHGRAHQIIPTLPDGSIDACITSPPWAGRGKTPFPTPSATDYPRFTCQWMEALRPKLRPDASVFLHIREFINNGVISDYVLRTRLALREAGWRECEELIFWCHDGNPRGSNQRPRRTWARVLWFSPTPRPYVDLKALRTPAQPKRGTIKDPRFQWQREKQVTTTRITDLLVGTNGSMKKHVDHPAKFPADLPRVLIQTFSRKNGIILDPFVGSGTTCIVARELGRRWIGIDCERAYVRLANRSIPK